MKTFCLWLAVLAVYLSLNGAADAQAPVFEDGAWVLPVNTSAAAPSGGGYSGGGYEQAIYDACARHGCDGNQLVRVASCESGMNPNAVGPHGEIGLFQFMDYTFYANGGSDIWNPYDQIEVAARMWANGQGYEWVCQ